MGATKRPYDMQDREFNFKKHLMLLRKGGELLS